MSLTAKDVSEILRLLDESSFDELSLEMDGVKLELRRGMASDAFPRAAKAGTRAAPRLEPPPAGEKARPRKTPRPGPTDRGLIEVPAPLLGLFYRAPKPGEPPFVEVGSQVEPDTVIGIIEVMKLMNSVHAGVRGEVVEIPAQNGALVEFDEILMRVRKAG